MEPLPAPPRAVASLAVHSQRVFRVSCLVFVFLALGSLVLFWPILIKENFEAYLQCDGPQHGRLHTLNALKKAGASRRLQLAEERTVPKFYVRLIYATTDGSNIFTSAYLQRIRNIERRLESLPSFRRFCLAGDGGCARPVSVINYFFASQGPGTIIPDGRGDKLLPIPAILANLGTSNSFFVDRYFGVSAGQLQAALEGNVTRSVFRFGVPLRGFSDTQAPGQTEQFAQFVRDELRPALVSASSEELRVYFYGDQITQIEVEALVWHDAAYAIGSLLFIFFYLWGYLRSLRLTAMALFCIGLCFPISYACYCLVYGHGKMIAINFLSFFVVLGVGADDVFVLHDVWALSRVHGTGDMALARRMWSMYCKAGMAIFATSATTAASFFANLASSIGPLRQFGFFMGTCITVNWIIVASLYPLVLVNHERSRCRGGPLLRDQSLQMEEQLVENRELQMEEEKPLDARGAISSQGPCRRQASALVTLSGVAVSVFALRGSVQNIRPSGGLPQFFPKDSNLGGLQDLQMRFGNETSIDTQELALCHGQLQPAENCQRPGRPSPLPLPLPPRSSPSPAPLPPLWHPARPTPRPRPPVQHPPQAPSPPQQPPAPPHKAPAPPPKVPAPPHKVPAPPHKAPARPHKVPAPPQQAPVAAHQVPAPPHQAPAPPHKVPASPHKAPAPPLAAQDLDVHLRVKGQKEELEELEDMVRAKILSSLQLAPEDLRFEISEGPGRRLADDFQVTLHFQHLSAEKEREVKTFLKQNQELLSLFGARDDSFSSTARPSSTMPRAVTPAPAAVPAQAQHPPPPPPPPPPPKAPPTTTTTTAMPALHLKKRGMTHDRQAIISVLFGVRQVPGSSFEYELDPNFDLSTRQAQMAVVDFCERLPEQHGLKVVRELSNCWPKMLKAFLQKRFQAYPTYAFWPWLRRFLVQAPKWVHDHMGTDADSVTWLQLDYHVELDIWSTGRQVEPYMDLWEESVAKVLKEIKEKFGAELFLGTPVPVSDLFQRAEAENRVVNSALSSWVVSVACALVALAAFTRSLWLSAIACFAMLSTAACSLYFITSVFQWSFGLMEAVSLIIFCGFSVDYPLHVVQAYVQERDKGAGVGRALREVGGAVASGCATTCGAALFLLCCQITIFTRFGQVLVVNMLFALVFALVWIPAVLELFRCSPAPVMDEGYGMGLLRQGSPRRGERVQSDRLMMEVDGEAFAALEG